MALEGARQQPFQSSKVPEHRRLVISGQGGLSCASVLAQYGQRVVVLEQHEVTGGGAHCFAVDGKAKWRFDAGHHITIPWHEQVLHLACGTSVPPVPFDKTSDRTVDGFSDRILRGEAPAGEEPVPIRDDAQLTAELIRRFPQHKANILRYMSLRSRCRCASESHRRRHPPCAGGGGCSLRGRWACGASGRA